MTPLEAMAAAGRHVEEHEYANLHWRIRSVANMVIDDPTASLLLAGAIATAVREAQGNLPPPLATEQAGGNAAEPEMTEARMAEVADYHRRARIANVAFVKAGLVAWSADGKEWGDLKIKDGGSAPLAGHLAVSELPPGMVDFFGPKILALSSDLKGYAARAAAFRLG